MIARRRPQLECEAHVVDHNMSLVGGTCYRLQASQHVQGFASVIRPLGVREAGSWGEATERSEGGSRWQWQSSRLALGGGAESHT